MKGRIFAVHYGEDRAMTMALLRSMERFLGADLDLVLVNNGPVGLFRDCLFPYVSFLESGGNLGYFGAVALGLVRFPVQGLDFVMVCNNDIELLSDDFFSKLDVKLRDWDVVAPSTKTLEGVEQNPHRSVRPSWARKLYARLFFSNYLVAKLLTWAVDSKNKILSTVSITEERIVFSPHGACMVLKSTFFERGGSLEHPVLLYGEEDMVAAQAFHLGLRVGFVPELKVRHLECSSVGKGFSLEKFRHMREAYRYVRERFPNLF